MKSILISDEVNIILDTIKKRLESKEGGVKRNRKNTAEACISYVQNYLVDPFDQVLDDLPKVVTKLSKDFWKVTNVDKKTFSKFEVILKDVQADMLLLKDALGDKIKPRNVTEKEEDSTEKLYSLNDFKKVDLFYEKREKIILEYIEKKIFKEDDTERLEKVMRQVRSVLEVEFDKKNVAKL